ncbi:hypothetical protein [Streptomyces sp. CC224B]|uniref:hypothetical protein n=1 Tax=Streptomyces sp. CC224B TaxID=3044571 RepID=UPI0024A93E53|nr:hypothetical protein [Streptomyces sp. CC224B]
MAATPTPADELTPGDAPRPAPDTAAARTGSPGPGPDPAPGFRRGPSEWRARLRWPGLRNGPSGRRPRLRRLARLAAPLLLALLTVPLATAAHHVRPAPYGDRFTLHARVEGDSVPYVTGRAVRARDADNGRAHWTYTRPGRRPLALLPARGHALVLWDDGLVTDTARGAVRWHRAIPASAPWLASPAARGGTGVLRLLDPAARMLAVVTPQRVAAYRVADGDLRWTLPAREGCAFDPARSVRRHGVLLIAQPCRAGATPWTAQLVAVDGLGRVTPRRTPLGNELPGSAGKPVARPR